MRILIVTPDSELSTQAELIAAANNNRPTILSGTVTKDTVLRHIASGEYNAIHFGSHGDEHALRMSDGMLHDIELEGAFDIAGRKGSHVEIVLLNSCKSVTAAARIHGMGKTGPVYVIGWRDDLEDGAAATYAANFWQNVRPNGDVHHAHELASQILLREFPDQEAPILINGIKAQLIQIDTRLQAMEEQIKSGALTRYERYMLWAMAGTFILLLSILTIATVTLVVV